MAIPEVGETLPDFDLQTLGGEAYRLTQLAARGTTLVVFFKRSCASCKLSLPFIERLHKNYPALQLIGISQDEADETQTMIADWKLSFPIVQDPAWQVAIAYDLFTVPSVFLLKAGGEVTRVNLGWNKDQYELLSQQIAQQLQTALVPLFNDADAKVPAFKPG